MTKLRTLLREDQNLLYTNFTKSNTMEDRKASHNNGNKSLQDLKKELQELSTQDAIKLTGGKTLERDKWNNHCGGIVPQ